MNMLSGLIHREIIAKQSGRKSQIMATQTMEGTVSEIPGSREK